MLPQAATISISTFDVAPVGLAGLLIIIRRVAGVIFPRTSSALNAIHSPLSEGSVLPSRRNSR